MDRTPRRKAHRLPTLWYHGAKCHFVTICCHQRASLLADESLVRALEAALNDACRTTFFGAHAYCFMPNHFHGLLIGLNESADLLRTMRVFKGRSTAVARPLGIVRLWQKGFYDHIIRNQESLNRIAWYILMNPVRLRLTDTPSAWPFSHWTVPDWREKLAPADSYLPPWKKSAKTLPKKL